MNNNLVRISTLASAVLVFTFNLGCVSKGVQPRPTVPAEKVLIHGDSRVGAYVSEEKGFSTNTFWIEGPSGLILLDTQFLLSAAHEALTWIEATTGKKADLAIILHPNPDKFNGTSVFESRGVKVTTSKQVADLIPEVHKDRHYWFYDRYKPDYPNSAPQPHNFGNKTTSVRTGGVEVKLHVLGAGCSGAHVVVEYDGHVFVGDLVANLGHAWLELGLIDEWLKRLDEIEKLKPTFVHPGRGPSGGAELLTRQRAYLKKVKNYVLKASPKKSAPAKQKEAVLARIQETLEQEYPGYSHPYFLEIGLPAVWDHYAK